MRREEAISIMTKVVTDMNTKIGEEQNVPAPQITATIEQMVPELNRVNGMIFDALYEAGVINLHG